jgi:hypothetical protein
MRFQSDWHRLRNKSSGQPPNPELFSPPLQGTRGGAGYKEVVLRDKIQLFEFAIVHTKSRCWRLSRVVPGNLGYDLHP